MAKAWWALVVGMLGALAGAAPASAQTYSFGVVPVRNAVLTAKYWNPILAYIGGKTGLTLEFATRKSSQEYSEAEARGEFDFVHNNHIFAPTHATAAYRVIARPAGKPLHAQIVVPDGSPIRALEDLAGREVGFPGPSAFAGYAAPMSALIQSGVATRPVFAGNQEGVMAQLRAGAIAAAGVNSRVMYEFSLREGFKYRALWTSEPYADIPIAVHPRVPPRVVRAVRDALIGMARDPDGLRVLEASAALIRQQGPYGFVAADDGEYRNQVEVYRLLWKQERR